MTRWDNGKSLTHLISQLAPPQNHKLKESHESQICLILALHLDADHRLAGLVHDLIGQQLDVLSRGQMTLRPGSWSTIVHFKLSWAKTWLIRQKSTDSEQKNTSNWQYVQNNFGMIKPSPEVLTKYSIASIYPSNIAGDLAVYTHIQYHHVSTACRWWSSSYGKRFF